MEHSEITTCITMPSKIVSSRFLGYAEYNELLNEGVHDKNILKAVIVYGGPGSGKSYVASRLFDIPERGIQSISYSTGLKAINSDNPFELQLKKLGIDPSSLSKMNDEDFTRLTVGKGSPREVAMATSDLQSSYYKSSRLGLIVQGTGKNIENVRNEIRILRALGYDCLGIFVNTPLEVALKRNSERDRKLPDSIVKDAWNQSINNLGQIENEFGEGNFIIVDNYQPDKIDSIIESTKKKIQRFLNKPIQNFLGREWIKNQKIRS